MAVGSVASLISSTDLEGVDGARNQTSNCHCVGFTEDAHSAVLVRPLPERESTISVTIRHHLLAEVIDVKGLFTKKNSFPVLFQYYVLFYSISVPLIFCSNDLIVVSELVFQDVTIGPVRLRPGQRDGVLESAQLVQHGNLRRH